jgi:hypothetical protein
MISYKQSRIPFVFLTIIAGFILSIWYLGQYGIIHVDGGDTGIFNFGMMFFVMPVFVLFLYLSIVPPVFMTLDEQNVCLKSTAIISQKIKIPFKSIKRAVVHKKEIDGDSQTILRIICKEDDIVLKLKNNIKSVSYFGFYDGNCFDCMINSSDKIISEVVNKINERIN